MSCGFLTLLRTFESGVSKPELGCGQPVFFDRGVVKPEENGLLLLLLLLGPESVVRKALVRLFSNYTILPSGRKRKSKAWWFESLIDDGDDSFGRNPE